VRPMGASESGGGRRDSWGQARPMGAVSRRAKSRLNNCKSGTDAKGSYFKVRIENCDKFYINIMYTEKAPWMSAVDGRGQ